MSHETPIVSLRDVTVKYGAGREILNHADLSLAPGSFHFLTGASGAGKSTLIRLLYLGQKTFSGHVRILGHDLVKLTTDTAAQVRQKIGVVFQDFRLLDHLSVIDNVALPLRIRGLSQRKACAIAQDILTWVGLDGYGKLQPDTLSGGEKQRVALARAVIAKPKLLLADEPTGSVDDAIAVKLLHLFNELNAAGTTVVLATHNRDLTGEFPHPEIHIHEGRLSIHNATISTREHHYAS